MQKNMIFLLALSALFLSPQSFLEREILNSSVAPIRCEIEMPSWCIATFNGSIKLSTEKNFRLWSLQHRHGMKAGRLHILESDYCTTGADEIPKLLHEKVIENTKSTRLHSVKYLVTKEGCTLEFNWPVSSVEDKAYEQLMKFGILIGDKNKLIQLNKAQAPGTQN